MDYKKVTIILSGVIVLLLVLSGLFLYKTKKDLHKIENEPVGLNHSNATQEVKVKAESIQDNYLNSQFRVLGVFKNEKDYPLDQEALNKIVNQISLVVATDRSADGLDYGCGGLYVMPTCYFFIEQESVAGAPSKRFVAKFTEGGSLDMKSITFKEPNLVNFTTANGDAGYMMVATWSLNLDTGEIKQLSKKETSI